MSERLAIGIAGCGRLAELGYLPAASMSRGARITAVADPDPERRALLARGGVAGYESVEDLAASGVEALVVASPPAAHEHAAAVAARAGLSALIEKPPAPDAAGAARIAALEPAPWIGFNRRFSLGAGAAGVLPEGGTARLEIRYRRFSWAPVAVRDPALTDLAPHLVDLALRAGVGEVRAVSARSRRPERLALRLEGTRGRAVIECASDRPHRERMVVRSADGAVVSRRRLGGLVRGTAARLARRPHPLVASLAAQLDEFALAARGAAAPSLGTAAEGAAVMAVIAMAAESLAHGGEAAGPAVTGAARRA